MKVFALANLALRFLLEVAVLVALGFWGFQATNSTWLNVILGLGAPLLAGVFWGIFMAPSSARRTSGAAYIVLETIIFGLATVALVAAGQPVIAIAFAVVSVLNAAAVHLTAQYAELPKPPVR